MAIEVPRFVLDASIAAKWYLQDEALAQESQAVLLDYREGRIGLFAPTHIRYEVPSAIRNALRTNRLTPDQAQDAIAEFLAWRIPTVDDDQLIQAGLQQALRFNCSLYDGLYLALAEAALCPFLHADDKLRRNLAGRFALESWIERYPSSR